MAEMGPAFRRFVVAEGGAVGGAEIEFTDIGGLIGTLLFGAAGGADEEPKYGGTLTYMIPGGRAAELDARIVRRKRMATIHSPQTSSTAS